MLLRKVRYLLRTSLRKIPELKMKTLYDKINQQISHLQYEREKWPQEKLGEWDMLRVKQRIDSEIKCFEASLLSEYRDVWTTRTPSTGAVVHGSVSATNAILEESINTSRPSFTGPVHLNFKG